MAEEHPIWSYSGLEDEELRQILSNPEHEEFVHLAARLLESSLEIEQVFDYIDKEDFIQHYSRIRKSMGNGAQAKRHKKFWDRMANQGCKQISGEPAEKSPAEKRKEKVEADYASESALKIGRRIRKLRKKDDLSQQELAERLGISKSEISRIENGKQNLSLERLQRVLNALGHKVHLQIKPVFEKGE